MVFLLFRFYRNEAFTNSFQSIKHELHDILIYWIYFDATSGQAHSRHWQRFGVSSFCLAECSKMLFFQTLRCLAVEVISAYGEKARRPYYGSRSPPIVMSTINWWVVTVIYSSHGTYVSDFPGIFLKNLDLIQNSTGKQCNDKKLLRKNKKPPILWITLN